VGRARAAVIEPNGTSVPGPSSNPSEMTLQAYFDSVGESINAVKDASTDPGVFLPLCDFKATLVQSQSSAAAGIDWYNQPAPPPAGTLYPIGPTVLTVGQTITSADIRSNRNYGGGLIGFALMKQLNGASNPATPVYYSEYMLNANCTGCTMPGYWKMALAYKSTMFPNSYYLAWEDWEGANTTTWFGNDGDFNDKVFRFDGVTCKGGGETCDTGMMGVCAQGVTQCQLDGTVNCVPLVKPTSETCDNLDNDCNGTVDDGSGLCDGNKVCFNGTCVPPCGFEEFGCVAGYTCVSGLCVENACATMTCKTGQVCRGGSCVGGCDGITCPLGQDCQLGVCVDLCAGVSCPGSVCEKGACVTSCACRVCPNGQTCASDGHCVDDGCETQTCGVGEVCRKGTCTDACQNAVCPGKADCHSGQCDPPMIVTTAGTAGTGGGGTTGSAGTAGGRGGSGGTAGTAGRAGTGGGATGAAGAGGDGSDAGTYVPTGRGGTIACGCTTGGSPGAGGAGLLLLALAARCRRRSRRSD
jgi:MYXO-CTERM domain-containing protein